MASLLQKFHYNSWTARWKRYTGQGMGEGHRASMPSPGCHSPQIFMCSPTWKPLNPIILGFYGGFNTYTWLIKSLVTGDWLIASPLPFLGRQGVGTKSSNPLLTWFVHLATSPHLQVGSKSHLIKTTRDTFMLSLLSKHFRSSVPETRMKTKYNIYLLF